MSQKPRRNDKSILNNRRVPTPAGLPAAPATPAPPTTTPARRRSYDVVKGEIKPTPVLKKVYPQGPVRVVAGKGGRQRGVR